MRKNPVLVATVPAPLKAAIEAEAKATGRKISNVVADWLERGRSK